MVQHGTTIYEVQRRIQDTNTTQHRYGNNTNPKKVRQGDKTTRSHKKMHTYAWDIYNVYQNS